MPSPEQFQIDAIVVAQKEHITQLVKQLALDIHANIKETTPVDTGHARANWVPSIGSPNNKEQGSQASVSNEAQGLGEAEVASASDLSNHQVWDSNNVSYVPLLNSPQTPSRKAPPFFIQLAILKALDRLNP